MVFHEIFLFARLGRTIGTDRTQDSSPSSCNKHAFTRPFRRNLFRLLLLSSVMSSMLAVLSGCGGASIRTPVSAASTGTLQASSSNVSFGSVSVGQTANSSVSLVNQGSAPVQISQITLSGQAFAINWTRDLPITIPAGGSYSVNLSFAPTASGAVTGQIAVSSNATNSGALVIGLNGSGTATTAALPSLTALNCASSSITGAGTAACMATLNTAAPSGGLTLSLSSNNTALTIPATVTIPAGTTSTTFTATAATVTANQTATITATAGGASQIFTIQLIAATQSNTNTPDLSDLTCTDSAITGAASDSCSVVLTGAAPASGVTIGLSSDNGAVTVPPSVTVPSGSITANFTANISLVNSTQTATLTATNGKSLKTHAIKLNGNQSSTAPVLSSLNCVTNAYTGAGSDSCTVTLGAVAPAGGTVVSLGSDNAAITVPGSMTVPAGATSSSFTAAIAAVTTNQSATLTASAGGASKTFALQLNSTQAASSTPVLSALTCTTSSYSAAGTDACTVTLSSAAPTGGLVASLSSNSPSAVVPSTVTVPAGATSAAFTATVAAVTTSVTATLTASAGAVTKTFALQLVAQVSSTPVLSALACTVSSFTGAGTDSCTVTLSAAAQSGGVAVALASSSTVVTVPGSVTVPAGATSATFAATVASASTAQTATLTASAGGVSKTFGLQINAGSAILSVNSSSIAFGSVTLNTTATQTVTLTSSGTLPVTVSSAAIAGTGFALSGGTFPTNLNPGQSVTLNVQFNPTVAGAATGTLKVVSNSATSPTTVITLTGTGASASHEVDLSWAAPTSSSTAVAGYNVYRATTGTSSYQQLNTSLATATTYVDSNVQSGQSYDYMVKSVDSSGATSAPSNIATALIP